MKRTQISRGTKQLKRTPFNRSGRPKSALGRTKKPKLHLPTLKKKLWHIFSLYIRNRDNWTCITCGQRHEGAGMHAGHFIPRSICGIALYFDECNVYAQCMRCNVHLHGYGAKFNQVLLERYGQDFIDELWRVKNTIHQWTAQDYLDKIAHYESLQR